MNGGFQKTYLFKIKKFSNLSKKFKYVGSIYPEKGILGILNSFIEIAKKDTTILTILGDVLKKKKLLK